MGLSDCQAPKRALPEQGVCSVEVPSPSSAAPALWCLPSHKSAVTIVQIWFIFIISYWKDYQKRVFGASSFCLAGCALSKAPVPPPDTSFCLLPPPQHLFCTPSSTFAGKLDAEPCHLSTSCAVSLAFIWAHGLNSNDTRIICFNLGRGSLFLLNDWPENDFQVTS